MLDSTRCDPRSLVVRLLAMFALHRIGALGLVGLLVLLGACDDPPPNNDRKSVIDGGKAESRAGKQLENAKREIDDTEKLMQDQDADRFERSGGEKVERGMPD